MLHLTVESVELRLCCEAQSTHAVVSCVLVDELQKLRRSGAGRRSKRQVTTQENGAICSMKAEGANAERLSEVLSLSDGRVSFVGPRRVVRVPERYFVSYADDVARDARSAEAMRFQ